MNYNRFPKGHPSSTKSLQWIQLYRLTWSPGGHHTYCEYHYRSNACADRVARIQEISVYSRTTFTSSLRFILYTYAHSETVRTLELQQVPLKNMRIMHAWSDCQLVQARVLRPTDGVIRILVGVEQTELGMTEVSIENIIHRNNCWEGGCFHSCSCQSRQSTPCC